MGLRSRNKGKRGEREAAAEIRRLFRTEARRGCQFSGGDGSGDLVTAIEGVHFEVKRTEALRLHEALRQAPRTPAPGASPSCSTRPTGGRGWPSSGWTICRNWRCSST